ncbi:E3 SUMO-protein ligase PIAS2 isoform X2, partial [Clarias magur]
TPVNRIPIMAKQVLDLYTLYKLVTEKGGLVEVINKKIWREITRGLNLPTSITSAAFTLRTQYMKYLYPYECEKRGLSSPGELQAAIDSNRREGRRQSYSSALFNYSPVGTPTLLPSPKLPISHISIGTPNGGQIAHTPVIKKEDSILSSCLTNRVGIPMALGGHHATAAAAQAAQAAQAAAVVQAAALEQLREKLEAGEPPEKKVMLMAEEQQRIMQHALQHNLFTMASHLPMNIKLNNIDDRQETALNLSTNGISSINMSIEINGVVYTEYDIKFPCLGAPGASTVQRFHQEKYFIFALTPQQVREVCISRDFLPGGRRDYMVQIQLRFCLSETSCPQEDNYPNSLCIKVNGKLFPLPGYAPPPKNGVEQKRPGRPLNITSLVRLSSAVPNQISVTWAPEIGKTYSMSVYLVRQLTSPLLLQRLRMKGIRNPDHSRALIKEKLTADPDSEIATTSLRVSLMCPLGKMRLTVPCRAVTCSHLQCFDAALYLQMNEKKPTWICPVCDKKAAYESLIIDGLFMEILNDCTDVDEIKFQEDGTWCPMRPKKETLKVSSPCLPKIEYPAPLRPSAVVPHSEPSSTKKADVIDLTLESSSDEEAEPDPPLKKRCLYMSKSEEMHSSKGVLTYQPSTVRVPNVQTLDTSYLTSSIADYAVPFHHTTLSTIPTDMPGLDLFSLLQADPQ